MKTCSSLLFVWAALCAAAVWAEPQPERDIEVTVRVAGDEVSVDLSMPVPATRQQAWAVLTDFDHMAGFIINLKESRIIGNSGGAISVFQRGSAQYGPVSFKFESTRELQLTPYDKIQSHLISGNMRKMEGTTQLLDEGAKTRILYHNDSIPGVWIPPFVGKIFIEHETREQFQQMRDEIIRRGQPAKSALQQTGKSL